MVDRTGRVHPAQTATTPFQEALRQRGKTQPTVEGRSRRLVETEKRHRRYDVSTHGDRCLLDGRLVHSTEEQVGGVVGGSAKSDCETK